ncbi:hypothetical protein DKX38_028212 [Salix brachista]|uniref:Uncharacterized protein n=1 Tax=Salix brachista TaxID=2182728 RepID=A0A5N5J6Y6_9ROSI|nr:hypothetical protein DKX38_028212 [Salix brachista]
MKIAYTILILIIQGGCLEFVILATGSIMVNFKILHPLMLEKEVVADLLAGFDEPGFGPGPHRGEGMRRNNPNVSPREGDWICTNPFLFFRCHEDEASSNLMSLFPFRCANLNFSSGEFCHNCKRPRYRSGGSPRRGYPGPQPPHAPPRRFPGPSLDLSPSWTINGYRSPPQGWARNGPRDFGPGGPPPRQGGRFADHEMQRDRSDYADDEYRGRKKFDRPMPMNWSPKDRGRDSFFHERKGFERQPPLRLYLSLHFLNVADGVVTGADRQLEEFLYPKSFVRICTWRGGEMIGILLGEAE